MRQMLRIALLICYVKLAAFHEPPAHVAAAACVIELQCAECVPEYMPLVVSPRVINGSVAMAAGEQVTLSCGAGRLLAYPMRATVAATCQAGRFRVEHDGTLRHLLELGCQQSVLQDVLHPVEYCTPPLQGRAYQMLETNSGGARHFATLCFDEDRGVAAFAHASNAPAGSLRLPPHGERSAPLSLLGNFNRMLDTTTLNTAEKLYSDETRTNRRLREILKHDRVSLAEQTLTAAPLLSGRYFDEEYARIADFVSNNVLAWRSVVAGNLRHAQRDVARLLRRTRRGTLRVYAGTHGVAVLRTERARTQLFLLGERFPVPEYVWTVVVEEHGRQTRALALVVLNDPFVAVSEIRERVFCESACTRVDWLHELRRQHRYEAPVYGLAFCCAVHDFAAHVPEMPEGIIAGVPRGDLGMLTEIIT